MEVTVGRVGRAHGVRGDVAVDVRTDEPERRFVPGASLRAERDARGTAATDVRRLVVESAREHSGRLLVRFRGVADRTAAEALRGFVLHAEVDPSDLPDEDDAFYDHQLVGLAVESADGSPVGVVTAVLHLPAQDTLAVAGEDGRELLVPFVEALVPDVDLGAGRLVVADVPGLLDPGAAEEAVGEAARDRTAP